MSVAIQPRKGLPFLVFSAFAAVAMICAPSLADTLRPPPQPPKAPVVAEGEVQPFVLQTPDPTERKQAVRCLAEAIYYEAGFEPLDGQRAVAQVVVNRVRDPNFPDSICGVVYQGFTRQTGCQFSFVCDGSRTRRPPSEGQLYFAGLIARQALGGYVERAVGSATHYHTDYVDPYWAPALVEVAKIGTHVFYRWPGKAGRPDALDEPYEGGEVRVASRLPGALT